MARMQGTRHRSAGLTYEEFTPAQQQGGAKGRYRAVVRVTQDGRELGTKTVWTDTLRDLRAEAARTKAELRATQGHRPDATIVEAFRSFEEAITSGNICGETRKTYETQARRLGREFAAIYGPGTQVRRITRQAVTGLFVGDGAFAGYAPATKAEWSAVIKRAWKHFRLMEWADLKEPTAGLNLTTRDKRRLVEDESGARVPYLLTTETVQTLLDAMAEQGLWKLFYIWILMISTGARRRAIVSLRRNRVNLKKRKIKLLEKNNKLRTIKLQGPAYRVVEFLMRQNGDDYLFAFPPKDSLRKRRGSYRFGAIFPDGQWAKVKDLAPDCLPAHSLRSLRLRYLDACGIRLNTIMKEFKWDAIGTMSHYMHQEPDDAWPLPLLRNCQTIEEADRILVTKILRIPRTAPAFDGWSWEGWEWSEDGQRDEVQQPRQLTTYLHRCFTPPTLDSLDPANDLVEVSFPAEVNVPGILEERLKLKPWENDTLTAAGVECVKETRMGAGTTFRLACPTKPAMVALVAQLLGVWEGREGGDPSAGPYKARDCAQRIAERYDIRQRDMPQEVGWGL